MPGPIRNTSAVPAGVTPSASPGPADTTTPATDKGAGWTPGTQASQRRPPGLGAITEAVGEAMKQTGPSSYDLIPGRLPGTVSLPQVLQGLASSPQAKATGTKLVEQLQAQTGIEVPPAVLAQVKQNPAALTQAFEVRPTDMAAGIAALNAAYRAGKVKNPPPRQQVLPKQFDLAALETVSLPRPPSVMKELAPGLFRGDLPSQLPDAQVKQNSIMAEVLQRLSRNASASADQKFEVALNGKSYSKPRDFIGALASAGYDVSVRFDTRVANFASLKTPVPGTNPQQFADVAAPLMVKTGIRDGSGKEAVVPGAHSEMTIFIKSGPKAKGPPLDATVRFFQGTAGTGFFPDGVNTMPQWVGRTSSAPLSGADAKKAVAVAGALTDVVEEAAGRLGLYADGYGVTGVCNDSVAVVQQVVTGTFTQYPLLMNDDVLLGEIKRRLSDGERAGDSMYRSLRQAINDLPTDTRPNPTAARRALQSIPWESGKEPFHSTVEARTILAGGA